jgi:hypothetical protein
MAEHASRIKRSDDDRHDRSENGGTDCGSQRSFRAGNEEPPKPLSLERCNAVAVAERQPEWLDAEHPNSRCSHRNRETNKANRYNDESNRPERQTRRHHRATEEWVVEERCYEQQSWKGPR